MKDEDNMEILIDVAAIFFGGLLGLFFNNGIPEKYTNSIMKSIAIVILLIGISGATGDTNVLIQLSSILLGVIFGEWLDIDGNFERFVYKIENKIPKVGSGATFAEGFITSALVLCVGSMTILGSIEYGLTGSSPLMMTLSVLDGVTALVLGSSLGYGVMFAAVPKLFLQGGIALLAGFIEPWLTQAIIGEIVAVGSVILVALALNLLDLTDFKIMNLTPAMVMPIIIMGIMSIF